MDFLYDIIDHKLKSLYHKSPNMYLEIRVMRKRSYMKIKAF